MIRLFKNLGASATKDGGLPEAAVAKPVEDGAQRLELLDDFERAGIGWFWATDADGRLTYISANAVENLGLQPDDLLGSLLTDWLETEVDGVDGAPTRPLTFQLSAKNRIYDLIVRAVAKAPQQSDHWWSVSGQPKYDSAGTFLGYRGSAKDVTAEFRRQLEDSRMAEFDSLTGLANRHRMTKRLRGR